MNDGRLGPYPRFFGALRARLDGDRTRHLQFFGELGARMGDLRRAERRRHLEFFAELSPRLESARALERALDRHLARRFNVFRYLNTVEVGLSRIIADLLNPEARHGQGTLFLRTLLDELTEISDRPELDTDFSKRIGVVTERVITNKRRLDISVEIPGSDGAYCLAIENKPFADDQPNQVRDYIRFLQREYADRFLLIYLSSMGQGPSERSLPRGELRKWEGRLAIMGYQDETDGIGSEESAAEDRFDGFRVGLSLAAWFSACRRRCEPDRLRWFLSEAEVFCRHRFGGHSMATDSETRTIKDYLFAHPQHLETAQSVSDVWLDVKAVVCGGFLEHLRTAVNRRVRADLPDIAPDLRVKCEYGGEKPGSNVLWLHRASWPPWENHHKKHFPYKGCTTIALRSGWTRGPRAWNWLMFHPLGKSELTDAGRRKRARLREKLRSEFDGVEDGNWRFYTRLVDDEMANWNSLLPRLYREWQDGRGPITDYYVNGTMGIATKAIRIIDEVEGTAR
jgi:hypothetical protein